MFRIKSLQAWSGAVAIMSVVATVAIYRYYRHAEVTLPDGQQVKDLSVAEAGELAGDDFKLLRIAYLRNLEFYKTLTLTHCGATDTNQFDSGVARSIAESFDHWKHVPAPTSDRPPEDIQKALAAHWAFMLRRASGMSADAYLQGLPRQTIWQMPRNTNLLADTLRHYNVGVAVPDGTSAADLEKLFRALESAHARHENGTAIFDAYALEPGGWRSTVCWVDARLEEPEPLSDLLAPGEDEIFVGRASQAQLLMHASPVPWEEIRKRSKGAWVAQVLVIGHTRGGDLYPLGITSVYDETTKEWFVHKVVREVSVRMMRTPPLVY